MAFFNPCPRVRSNTFVYATFELAVDDKEKAELREEESQGPDHSAFQVDENKAAELF
jgi:hypothetical protein